MSLDIQEHLDFIYDFCRTKNITKVVEYGTRDGHSTTAFLHAGATVICVDLVKTQRANQIQENAGENMGFTISNTADYELPYDVDLLFIDTLHTYAHVKAELATIKGKFPKYIMFHDTVLNGSWDEDNKGGYGIMSAILEFMAQAPYFVIVHRPNNCGLTVIERYRDVRI
jgi:cephalosporin hydroxylase